MSKYFLFLQTVNDTVNDLGCISCKNIVMRKNFSEPKLFTGGININEWKNLIFNYRNFIYPHLIFIIILIL